MMINWKVRFKNKTFWITLIPAVLVLVQTICTIFGVNIDFAQISAQLIAVVNAIFVILGIVGIVVDPTTAGVGDTARAMGYDKPHSDDCECDGCNAVAEEVEQEGIL